MTASFDICEKMSIDVAVPPLEIAWPLPTRNNEPPDTPKLLCKFDEVSVVAGNIAGGLARFAWLCVTVPTEAML